MNTQLPSRRSTHSIMANSGFGNLTIHTGSMSIDIPKEQITQKGNIKNSIFKRTQVLTRENIEYLESKGVKVFTRRDLSK